MGLEANNLRRKLSFDPPPWLLILIQSQKSSPNLLPQIVNYTRKYFG